MKEAFKVFDKDQDGYISANEVSLLSHYACYVHNSNDRLLVYACLSLEFSWEIFPSLQLLFHVFSLHAVEECDVQPGREADR